MATPAPNGNGIHASVEQTEDTRPVMTVEQEEQLLKGLTRKRPERKKVLIRLCCYCAEMMVVVLIAAQIPDPLWATLLSVVIAFILTKVINVGLNKLFKEKGPKSDEAGRDTRQELIQKVTANWNVMPEFFKDQVVSFLYKGESVKLFFEIRKKRSYQNLVVNLLQARKAFREKDYATARRLVDEISKKADMLKHLEIVTEAQQLRAALP